MRKVGIMQPYFLPYIGYFQLIKSVDKFVVYDDVKYINRGWINKNKMLINNKESIFYLGVKKDLGNLNINERYFCDDIERHISKLFRSIERAYKKAPMFNTVMPIIEDIFKYDIKINIAEFLENSLIHICDYLNIETEIIVSSQINKNCTLRSQDKIIDIVKELKGDIYINSIGGQKLYSKEVFRKNNIKLYFLNTKKIYYKQYNEIFVPNLSILDIMMFNSKESIKKMLTMYELI
ncbi:MAG: hypothetical protein E7207_04740 [Clostridium butyricum]|nr:hypothetical protein [Clostridium butyricum]